MLVEQLSAALEAVPDDDVYGAMPPTIATTARLARRMGMDLVGSFRDTALASLRQLPEVAERDPDRAAAVMARVVWVIAWLDGQVEEAPAISDVSSLVAGWPSSDGAGPASP